MARFQFDGIDDYISELEKLYGDTEDIIGAAIYQGAGVVMKSVVSAIAGIQTDERFGTPENKTIGPNSYQKEGLVRSIGIAKLRKDGSFWNVKFGFDGYNGIQTKTWPNGQPNAMVARSVESGTSWMKKQPFMRKAESSSRVRCEAAMANEIDKQITKRVKES